ncbi:ATP-binding protein [Halorutilales archaeon Cl-col2-1]
MSESHGSFRKIVESLDDGVVLTQEGEVRYINDAAVEVLGRGREEVKGSRFTEFVRLEEGLGTDGSQEGKVVSGSEASGKPVEVDLSEVEYEGSPASLVVLRDITERKEMEEILECIQMIDRSVLQAEEEDDLLDWACEVLASRQKGCTSIAVLNDDGDLSDIYSAGRLSGTDSDGDDGGWQDVYTDDYIDEILENGVLVIDDVTQPPYDHHSDSVESHKGIGVALSHRGNDYGAMTVHLPPQGISENEKSLLEGFAYDLSTGIYALRTEDRIKKENEELILLNRIVRHDIRNDMNLILGWGSELRDHVDEEGEEYLDTVLDASQHVVDLTKTARDFVESIESGEETDLGSVDLRDTVEHVTQIKRETYDDAEFSIEGIPDVEVRANSLLSTVFRNILNNAVQHNDCDTPRIEITAERDEEKDEIVVCVSDNGDGVSDNVKESIFGKEEKGLESRGTGIGLYLVRTLVDEYGGDVWVEDRHDVESGRRGSVFKVRLKEA